MLGNFFNNMYYGKNRSDYTPDQLPKNRIQLFFEMLRIRFAKLIQLNFIFMIFALPYVLWIAYNYQVLNEYADAQDLDIMIGIISTFLIGNIICQTIMGAGMPGLALVTRNYARDQHAWVWSDFIDAVKANWKQGMLMGFLKGLILFLLYYAVYLDFTLYNYTGNVLLYVLGYVTIMFFAISMMADMYIWPMIVSYNLKLRHIIRNSIMLAIARLPFSVLFLLIQLVPIALIFLHPLVSLYYVVLGFSMTQFITVSYVNAVFDRFINVHIEGAAVNQGLRKPEDEDEYEDD